MDEILTFSSRAEFRLWLEEYGTSKHGVWLLFGKKNGPKTLSSKEALEEALCFGWIDGVMQRIDDTSYKKYFSIRRSNSKWSDKNKKIVMELEKQGKMTAHGKAKVEEAKQNGQWDRPKAPPVTEQQITSLADILKAYEPAYTNFMAMSPSVKKTYTKAYFNAKTETGRKHRIKWMVERLNKNLKPM